MAFTTASAVVTGAYQALGVVGQGRAPSAFQMADGLRRINMLLGSWSIQPATIPVVAREVFPLVAGKGGPNTPYTIGPGGDFDTTRPATLKAAGCLLNASTPPVEIPRDIATEDAYEAIAIKDLTNALFTSVYYNATFASGFGTVYLWPIPNTALNSLVLYRQSQLALFSSTTAQYDLPEGMDEALEYNLAVRLAAPSQVAVPEDVKALARSSLYFFKRSNHKFTEMPIDPMFTSGGRGGYNIDTGQ